MEQGDSMPNEFPDLDKGAIRLRHSIKSCQDEFLKLECPGSDIYKREPFKKLDWLREMALKSGKRKVFRRSAVKFTNPFLFTNANVEKIMRTFESGQFKTENYPVLTAFLEGKTITVKKNAIHLRLTPTSYIPPDEGSLKMVFDALLDRWLDLPNWLYPGPPTLERGNPCIDVKVLRDTLVIKAEPVQGYSENRMQDYSFIFDTEVRLITALDLKWNAGLYSGKRNVNSLNKLKLLWDLMHYGERLRLVESSGVFYTLLYSDENQLDEDALAVKLDCPTVTPQYMAFRLELMAEIAECEDLLLSANALKPYFGDTFAVDRIVYDVLDKKPSSVTISSFDKTIESLQKFLDGLCAAKKIMERFAAKTKQSKTKPLEIGVPAAKILIEKIRMDPIMYADDSRKFVAEIARKLMCG